MPRNKTRTVISGGWETDGFVTGRGNTGGGNAEGDACPEDISFLFTEEGGELDRRR